MAKRKDKLSPMRRAFLREKIKNPLISNRKAMRKAGFAETTINSKNSQVFKSVQGGLNKAMERAGITDDLLAKGLKEGIEATKVSRVQFRGAFGDEAIDNDLPTRKQFIELTAKLRGDLVENKGVNINFISITDLIKEADVIEAKRATPD